MKSVKYGVFGFLMITLFTNSCSEVHWSDEYCDDCSGTGLWTDVNNDSHTCFSTQEECMEWVRNHKPNDDVCIKCGD